MNYLYNSHFFNNEPEQSISPFQPNVAFHIKTSHLTGSANQITGFRMKCNTGLKCVNLQTFL